MIQDIVISAATGTTTIPGGMTILPRPNAASAAAEMTIDDTPRTIDVSAMPPAVTDVATITSLAAGQAAATPINVSGQLSGTRADILRQDAEIAVHIAGKGNPVFIDPGEAYMAPPANGVVAYYTIGKNASEATISTAQTHGMPAAENLTPKHMDGMHNAACSGYNEAAGRFVPVCIAQVGNYALRKGLRGLDDAVCVYVTASCGIGAGEYDITIHRNYYRGLES